MESSKDKRDQASDQEYVDFMDPSEAHPHHQAMMEDDFYEPFPNSISRDQEEQKMEGLDEEVHTQPINDPVSSGAKPNPLLAQASSNGSGEKISMETSPVLQAAPIIQSVQASDTEMREENPSGVPIQKKDNLSQSAQEELEYQQNMKKQLIEDERKRKVKAAIKSFFLQVKVGCSKDLCFNRWCYKNPLEKSKLQYSNDQDRLRNVVEILNSAADPFTLICSESKSFNQERLEFANEKDMLQLLEDAYAFASSFVLEQKIEQDQEMADHSGTKHLMLVNQATKIRASAEDLSILRQFSIDFTLVEKMIKKFETSFSTDKLKKSLESLVQIFAHEIQSGKPSLSQTLMIWRSMLILLHFPQLSEWDWNQLLISVLKKMQHSFDALRKSETLPAGETQKLTEYITLTIEKKRMLNIIQTVQSSITISIMSGMFSGKDIEVAVRVSDVFNEANNLKPFKDRVEYKEFYNDAINKEVNLKDHYIMWVQERERCRQQHRQFDRLKIFTLCSFPWILDSANKAELLKLQNKIDQERSQQAFNIMDLLNHGNAAMYLLFEVSREKILDDALNIISKPGLKFTKPLRVVFKGEPGIDEGGVRKEFFQLLIRSLFDPMYAMFTFNDKNVMYYLNGLSHEPNINFELIGILMGLAIYNNIILDVSFPQAIYKLLLFEDPNFDDLREWQPDIAQSLEYILNYAEETPLEEALGMTFTIPVENFGAHVDVDLKEGGALIYVNEQNREEYVNLYVQYTFVRQCEDKLRAFKRGFYKVCDEALMSQLFKPQELEQLVCGSRVLDFHAWQKNCRFIEGYNDESPQGKWLWEIIHEDFSDEQKRKFLAFTTGSDRAPILGLGSVKLYVGRHGEDSEMLPSSHTCFNHLLIPEYATKEKLKQKLLLAIENAEGFGLM